MHFIYIVFLLVYMFNSEPFQQQQQQLRTNVSSIDFFKVAFLEINFFMYALLTCRIVYVLRTFYMLYRNELSDLSFGI
jgi:hypothetical protein